MELQPRDKPHMLLLWPTKCCASTPDKKTFHFSLLTSRRRCSSRRSNKLVPCAHTADVVGRAGLEGRAIAQVCVGGVSDDAFFGVLTESGDVVCRARVQRFPRPKERRSVWRQACFLSRLYV